MLITVSRQGRFLRGWRLCCRERSLSEA